MNAAAEPSAGLDLAREPDFALGGLPVSPSACRVGDQRVEPRVMEVLVVLVRHAGQTVTRDQLIDACWGGRAVSDDAVTRVVAQVRALARDLDPRPFVLETVPKVGFRLLPAPGGAREARTVPPLRAPRLLVALAAAIAIVAAAGLAWWWFVAPRSGLTPEQNGRVEVIAFEPLGGDPAVARVADDISDSLVRVLAGGGVQTTEHPVARDDASGDAELRVAGSVSREGNAYVVNAQVLDRKTGLILWKDRLERPVAALAQSPGEISEAVAALIHCALEDRKPARVPVSTEAFGLYLNACAAVFVGGDEGRMLAVTRRLVKAAPRFAGAHAMHAIAAGLSANRIEHSPTEAAALHAEAEAAAKQALRLDPDTPKAYDGLALNAGALSDRMRQDWFLQEYYIRKALSLDPDMPPARNEYTTFLRMVGRWNEAIEFIRTTNASGDPRSGGGDGRVAMMLAARGDLREAYQELDKLEAAQRVSQDSMRRTIILWWEDPRTALPRLAALFDPAEAPERPCYERFLRELEARRAARTRGLPPGCEMLDRNWQIRMLARLGDVDGAFARLDGRVPGGPLLLYYPEMKDVRRDPRFWPLAKRLGLVDYWQKSDRWPDFCAEPDLPYDCRKAARATAAA